MALKYGSFSVSFNSLQVFCHKSVPLELYPARAKAAIVSIVPVKGLKGGL